MFRGRIWKYVLILGLLILFVSNIFMIFGNRTNLNYKENKEGTIPLTSSESTAARPLGVIHHAEVTEEYYPLGLPSNVSFKLAEGWTSKNVTINYDGVSHKKERITNGEFNDSSNKWTYKEEDDEGNIDGNYVPWKDINDDENSGSLSVEFTGGSYLKGEYGYHEQNISIKEGLSSNPLKLTFNYFQESSKWPNATLYAAIIAGGVEKNKTIHVQELLFGKWTTVTLEYNPVEVGQSLPGNLTVLIGTKIRGDSSFSGGTSTIFIDNVNLKMWTEPNNGSLLKAFDFQASTPTNYSYINTTYGEGYSFIDIERSVDSSQDMIFTIFSNYSSPGVVGFDVEYISISSYLVKSFNTSFENSEGSHYIINEIIHWYTEFTFSIPYGYINNWAEIQKPIDWTIISILDSYGEDQVLNCPGSEQGSSKLIISQSVFSGGNWEIEARSENYIDLGEIIVWEDSHFKDTSNVTFLDKFQVNITLNDTLSNLEGSLINLTIYSPNNTIFWQESKEPAVHNVKFGNFTVGKNMTIGKYILEVIWTNNPVMSERDKIGYTSFSFNLWHNTSLNTITSYFEKKAGEPLIIGVNYTDDDVNSPIDNFETPTYVTYNSTFGATGVMSYQGLGKYSAEIDTSSLGLGDYYFSVNISKDYYVNQSKKDLIQLKIITEQLELEVPNTVVSVMANSNATFKVNLTGAETGTFYSGNLSTDWKKNFTIEELNDGIFKLNISTWAIPHDSFPQTYRLTIYANKTNYGETFDYVFIEVTPLEAEVNLNDTTIKIPSREKFYIKANYTDDENNLIIGATCNVTWEADYEIITESDGFTIIFNTTGLENDIYTAYIKINKSGFEHSIEAITVTIQAIPTLANVNVSEIQIPWNEMFSVKVNYTEKSSGDIIPEPDFPIVEWEGDYDVRSSQDHFIIVFNTSDLIEDFNTATIELNKIGYDVAYVNIYVSLIPHPTNIHSNITEVEVYWGKSFSAKINYTDDLNDLITDASIKVSWSSNYKVNPNSGQFNIQFKTEDLNVGVYSANVRMNKTGFESASINIYITIKLIPTNLKILNDGPYKYTFGDLVNIDCQFSSNYGDISNAEVQMMGELNGTFKYTGNYFSFLLNTSKLEQKVYAVQIIAKKANAEAKVIDFVFEIIPLEIEFKVNSSSIVYEKGENNTISFRLFDKNHQRFMENLTLKYKVGDISGEIYPDKNGTYHLDLDNLNLRPSNEPYELKIYANNSYGEDIEYSIYINIPPQENNWVWLILAILTATATLLGILSFRSYYLIPKKKAKKKVLLKKTQRYKDVRNIQALILSHKVGGLSLYFEAFRFLKDSDGSLFSGFIQAIVAIAKELATKEDVPKEDKPTVIELSKGIMEINFKYFNTLIVEYRSLRLALLLNDKSSNRLKEKCVALLKAIYEELGDEIDKFDGDLLKYQEILPSLLIKHLNLHYKKKFRLTENEILLRKFKHSRSSSSMELRILNILEVQSENKKEFPLELIIQDINEYDKNKVIRAVENLIKQRLIIPSE